MLRNINCLTTTITLEGIERIKTEKDFKETAWKITQVWEWAKIYFSLKNMP